LLLDERGRLFGLVNIIDLAVLVLVVVLVIGFFQLRAEPGAGEDVKTVRMHIVIPLVHPDAVDDLNVGDQLVARGQPVPVWVKDIKVRDSLQTWFNSDGEMTLTTNPFRKDLVVVLEGRTAEVGPTMQLGYQEIRVGLEEYIVKTRMFEKKAEITEIEIIDEDK